MQKKLQNTSEKFAQTIIRNQKKHIAFFDATATATKAELYNQGVAVCAPLGAFGYTYTCIFFSLHNYKYKYKYISLYIYMCIYIYLYEWISEFLAFRDGWRAFFTLARLTI